MISYICWILWQTDKVTERKGSTREGAGRRIKAHGSLLLASRALCLQSVRFLDPDPCMLERWLARWLLESPVYSRSLHKVDSVPKCFNLQTYTSL